MKEKQYQITADDREMITARIKECLEGRPDVIFAYLHGSFVTADRFRDIDVAVFLREIPGSPLESELALETEIGGVLQRFPVDLRVLNNAPLSFRYNVIRYGKPVFIVDDDARCHFEEATISNYFDFAPFRKLYLKEALGLGI